jgi:hypothetical protein
LFLVLAGSIPVHAQIQGLEIHGFGGWAYGDTDGNRYDIATEDGEYRNADFTLNLTASPIERLRLVGQIETALDRNETEVEIDYAFMEWAFSDALRFRAGRIKQPIGLYNEIFDVGTLRPFFRLPQSLYGPNGISSQGYNGLGVTGIRYWASHWGLQYDAYVGEIDGEISFAGVLAQPGEELMDRVMRDFRVTNLVGMRLNIHTPREGLLFGISAYVGTQDQLVIDNDGGQRDVYGAHVEYLGEKWWLRGEVLHYGIDLYSEDGVYGEAAYKLTDHWQVAARYDWWDFDLPGFDPTGPTAFLAQTIVHKEASVGLNYWFHPNAVIKLAVQRVSGNRFAFPQSPEDIQRVLVTGELDPTTQVVTLGTQFSF